jgi:hypothetical protein
VGIRCTECGFPLSNDVIEARDFRPCHYCGSETMALVFPAMFASTAMPTAAEMTAGAGEATCFYHSTKRAAVPCSQCGRFLCALCNVDLSGVAWCPECLEAGRTRKRLVNLENQRTLYDSIALALSIWPFFLFFYPSLIAAPASIFVSIFHWNRPTSIVRRHTKWRRVLALIFAVFQVGLWITLMIFAIYQFRKGALNLDPDNQPGH